MSSPLFPSLSLFPRLPLVPLPKHTENTPSTQYPGYRTPNSPDNPRHSQVAQSGLKTDNIIEHPNYVTYAGIENVWGSSPVIVMHSESVRGVSRRYPEESPRGSPRIFVVAFWLREGCASASIAELAWNLKCRSRCQEQGTTSKSK